MSANLNHQQYDRICKIVVSRVRNRPWTWGADDLYQESYKLCLEYDPKFPRLVRRWGRENWLLYTVLSEVIRRCNREQDWARRKFPEAPKSGVLPHVSAHEAHESGEAVRLTDPATFLADHSCPEEYTDLMDAVAALKPQERQMILLRLKGWSTKLIANYRGLSQPRIDAVLTRAVGNLRVLMRVE